MTGRKRELVDRINCRPTLEPLTPTNVLSISGYHMAVVAGVMFFAFRALFALMPAFSSRHPIKN